MQLPKTISSQIDGLSSKGNDLCDESRFAQAIEKWRAARRLG